MFGVFKKRQAIPTNDQAESAGTEVKEKWIVFHNTVHLTKDVPLAQKIDMFVQPLSEFFQTKYPELLVGGSEIFWLTTFTAILESGTHSKEEVNSALSQLRSKYSPTADVEDFKEAFGSYIAAVSQCATEMTENASYIERELPKVVMSENLRNLTSVLCASLHATSDAARKELENWRNNPPKPQDLVSHISSLTNLLFRNKAEMHGVVMALRAQGDLDRRFSLGSMLVGESAGNILIACNKAADAGNAVTVSARA